MIRFDKVSKLFPGGTTAVDELSLEVPDGKLTVFVGSSGSGKTTALRMINRMIEPTSGTVTVDGADVSRVNPVKLRLGIGYVIQNAGLMPHQRVIDNVATVPVLQGQRRRAARRAAYALGWTPSSLPAIPRSSREANNNALVWRAPWPPIHPSC
jgi:osmoprotectant transport system ATP-binding protein